MATLHHEEAMGAPAAVLDDDATLVRRAAAGDERAFTALYRRHVRYVASVLYRILRRDAELDDVLQQTFADAYVGISRLREPEGFRPWVVRIAVRRAADCLSARQRRRSIADAVDAVTPRVSNPKDQLAIEALYRALDRLSPRLRIPWILVTLQGETVEEVAGHCDISPATAKRRIARAAALMERRLRAG